MFNGAGLEKYTVCSVCNLGHTIKLLSRHAGLENVRFVGSNFEIVGASWEHTNCTTLYTFDCWFGNEVFGNAVNEF